MGGWDVRCCIFGIALGSKDLRFDYSVLAMRDAQSPAMQALLALQQDQQTTDYSVHVLADDADGGQLKVAETAVGKCGEHAR